MFPSKKPKSKLQLEIDRLVLALKDHQPESKEYAAIISQLKELSKVQKEQSPATVSPDTKLQVAANLAGIVMIIQHEHVYVIASKALAFVPKLR